MFISRDVHYFYQKFEISYVALLDYAYSGADTVLLCTWCTGVVIYVVRNKTFLIAKQNLLQAIMAPHMHNHNATQKYEGIDRNGFLSALNCREQSIHLCNSSPKL